MQSNDKLKTFAKENKKKKRAYPQVKSINYTSL